MEVKYKKEFYILKAKERKIDSEAPAVKVKMLNNEEKVIGMMAPKIQVMLTMPEIKDYNNGLNDILNKYKSKLLVYLITNSSLENIKKVKDAYDLEDGFISNDFSKFSLKFGVNLDEELIAKSVFIIDKEGAIKYKEIPSKVEASFNLDELEIKLEETVNYKAKGHVHENWMGV